MLEFSLPLNTNFTRPIISLYSAKVLIDSGAELPILDTSEEVVKKLFQGKLLSEDCTIKGVGGSHIAKVYRLHKFAVGKMVYRDIPVLLADINDVNVDMILGSAMFGAGIKYTIDTKSNTVSFCIPDEAAMSGKLYKRTSFGWGVLDFINGNWVVEG